MVEAATVGAALVAARDAFPELRRLLDDEEGRRRRHVNVFYNDVDEDSVEDRDRPATDRDEILIIQSVSGGSDRPRPYVD
jgi:molybdopterin converting factor small subunit